MYRKDVLAKKGITMPEKPTWDQVADIAAKVDGAEPGMKGICLRGLPGWGEMFAPLTTVVNTFGGTWFEKDWTPKVNDKPFEDATNFYVNLVKEHGEPGAAQAGFTECLNAMSQGKVAMWYDATSAAGSLEDPKVSKVAGKVGYAFAPVKETDNSGWLWAWAWAMPKTTKKADAAAQFMLWASSKEYEELVGKKLGWTRVPAGKRESTYENPDYKKAAAAFGAQHAAGDRGGQPDRPRCPAAADRRRAVRRDPRVPGPGHQGVPGHRRGHRRPRHGRTRPWTRDSSSPRKSPKELPVAPSAPEHRGGPSSTPGAVRPGTRGTRHQHPAASPGGRHDRHVDPGDRDADRAAARASLGQGAVVSTWSSAAGADLHHHRHPDPVPADARDLDAELEHPAPGREELLRARASTSRSRGSTTS